MRTPKECPSCKTSGSFAACGPGVERIAEEARAAFPDARQVVLASDTVDNTEPLKATLDRIRAGEVNIIIGTQIIAKGHHFPNLTLVGVVDADLGLKGGELRAAERTYQLLHQVAGRAGRAEKLGRVYLQSFMPEHRIMKALSESVSGPDQGGHDAFLDLEAQERRAAGMPPFTRLAGIIVSGRDESSVRDLANILSRSAPQGMNAQGHSIRTLGPAPAPLARLRGKYRYRLLVVADKGIHLQKAIERWLAAHKIPASVRVQIDIDPQSFF